MPDAAGAFKGTGWSRAGEAAWERAFGSNAASQQPADPDEWCGPCPTCLHVPTELPDEVPHRCTQTCRYAPWRCPDPRQEWLADCMEAEEDWGEEADDQAARDGYNPAR